MIYDGGYDRPKLFYFSGRYGRTDGAMKMPVGEMNHGYEYSLYLDVLGTCMIRHGTQYSVSQVYQN
jgi:hypothetical protein